MRRVPQAESTHMQDDRTRHELECRSGISRFAVGTLVATALMLLSSCRSQHVSGTYIASTPTDVTLLQLVETPDHHVTGRMEDFASAADGTINNVVMRVDGAVDGSELTLIMKPLAFAEAGITASATLGFNSLTLAARGSTVTLQRSDLSAYQEAVNSIASNAARARQAKYEHDQAAAASAARAQVLAEAQAQSASLQHDLDQFDGTLNRLGGYYDAALAKLEPVDGHYRSITGRMQNLLGRSLATTRSGDFQRGQYSYTISTGLNATETLHEQVQTVATNVGAADSQVNSQWASLSARCAAITDPGAAARCKALGDSYAAIGPHRAALAERLRALEGIYQDELAKQQSISQQAST
jgi:hypothetical protein